MAEMNVNKPTQRMTVRHLGRGSQVWIYLGKMLRMFIYQNDWKVLPMSALIAGLVGMVIRKRMFINMEGTLMGAFAMVMVCIWNGCFNSIQVICRERDVIKREHRSGMHISSYIVSHMLYQALLCLMQTVVTLYVTKMTGMQYPAAGLVTPVFLIDFGITLFLITFASDMMSLWVSCLARTTTAAMTIMPFVLIFQLVFSGGMIALPAWTEPLTHFTISNPGLKVIATQSNYNNQPLATLWNTLMKMKDSEVSATVTVGQVMDLLENAENATIQEIRSKEIGGVFTLRQAYDAITSSGTYEAIKDNELIEGLTLGQTMDFFGNSDYMKENGDMVIDATITLGEIVDKIAANPDAQNMREMPYTFSSTVGNLIDMVGESKVQSALSDKAREASYNPDYDYTMENVVDQWFGLLKFILIFAVLSTITLEFIDKDKR